MAEIYGDNEFAAPESSKQEIKRMIIVQQGEDQSSCLNASREEILELLKGDDHVASSTAEAGDQESSVNIESEGKAVDRAMADSFIGADPAASMLCNVDTKERDWVSIQAPPKQADRAAGENAEWISVDVPGHQKPAECSPPCSLVEWIKVDMQSTKVDARNGMEFSEHVCVRFSEREERTPCHKYYAPPSGFGPVPRARKRRTISGKIRARIEAFENSFRQELDRLNSPLAKVKNRRIHEGLRRGAAAAVAVEERAAADFREVQQRMKRLSISSQPDAVAHQSPECSSAASLPPPSNHEVETALPTCSSSSSECQIQETGTALPETSTGPETVENSLGQQLPELLNESCETSTAKAETCEDEEWELAGKAGAEALEQETEGGSVELISEDVSEDCRYMKNQASVGGLMKQVISGAALLAGLIFLWPRGNNLIWRAPQKRKRYNLVTRPSSYQEITSYNSHQGHRLNLDRFKG